MTDEALEGVVTISGVGAPPVIPPVLPIRLQGRRAGHDPDRSRERRLGLTDGHPSSSPG